MNQEKPLKIRGECIVKGILKESDDKEQNPKWYKLNLMANRYLAVKRLW